VIGRLTGRLVERDGTTGIIDVRDVGYEVFAAQNALEGWIRAGDDVTVYVSTQVREDAIALYAFPSLSDREAFLKLISVSGIGPKLALAALDALDIDQLAAAIEGDDVRELSPASHRRAAQRPAPSPQPRPTR
jgi:Holliday junction DNA helicase RuvA